MLEGRVEISNRGRVRYWSKRWFCGARYNKGKWVYVFYSEPKIRKTCFNKHGYELCGISINGEDKTRAIHRLVALYFCINLRPNIDVEVDHVNGIKSCNNWWNLEWVCRMESIDRAFKTGLIKPALGENQGSAKLTNEIVLLIYNSVEKSKVIAEKYSISTHTVLDIKRGRTWWHITGQKRHIKPSEKGRFKL